MRKRLFQWLRAAMLVCATVWVVSCSTDDNAVIKPADRPGAAYLSRKQIVPKIMEILQ